MSAQWRDVEQRYGHGRHGMSGNHHGRASIDDGTDDDDDDNESDAGYDSSRVIDSIANGSSQEDALLVRIRQLQAARQDIDRRMRSLGQRGSVSGSKTETTFPSLPPALPPIGSQQHIAGHTSY